MIRALREAETDRFPKFKVYITSSKPAKSETLSHKSKIQNKIKPCIKDQQVGSLSSQVHVKADREKQLHRAVLPPPRLYYSMAILHTQTIFLKNKKLYKKIAPQPYYFPHVPTDVWETLSPEGHSRKHHSAPSHLPLISSHQI